MWARFSWLSIFLCPSSCLLFCFPLFHFISIFLSSSPDLSLLLAFTQKRIPLQEWHSSICVCRSIYGRGVDHAIHHWGKVPLPPQKSEQTASAGAGTHTYTHVWIFGRRFWWHRAELSLPYNTAVFYGVTCISVPVSCEALLLRLPSVLTLTGRRCQRALNVTAQVNLCPAVTASIEGCLSTRILN